MDTMRAGKMVEIGKMVCEQTAVRPPDDGELLVKTRQASICGSDLHVIYDGLSFFPPPAPPGFPGHEAIGEVIVSNDPRFSEGDQVLTCPWPRNCGCFADYQAIAADFCLKLPKHDGPVENLMMAQQLGTVMFAWRKNTVDLTGKTVMVQGLGSAGSFFSYLAKLAGAAKVIASDLSQARVDAAAPFGVDVAVKVRGNDVHDAIMDHTDGQGADFLVEAAGRNETLLQCVELMREGGSMLLFGLPETTDAVPFNYHQFFRRKLTAFCEYGAQHEVNLASFREALRLIADDEIDVSSMVSHLFSIEDIDTAMRTAQDRSDNALKVSLSFN